MSDWDRYRETEMRRILSEIDYLIELHSRQGDSLQKAYLYKARRALLDGCDWFHWERRKKHYE